MSFKAKEMTFSKIESDKSFRLSTQLVEPLVPRVAKPPSRAKHAGFRLGKDIDSFFIAIIQTKDIESNSISSDITVKEMNGRRNTEPASA